MSPTVRRRLTGAGLGFATLFLSIALGAPAGATTITVPSDPQVSGPLTLCNAAGVQVTSGSMSAKPPVARAIDNTAAPKGYRKKGTATLYGFQPRPDTPPAEWSPEQLTGSSNYSDPSHPTAAATVLDETFATYLHDYPLASDGVFQLRVYLGAPGVPIYSTMYDASYIHVVGGTWTQLNPGADICKSSGQSVSDESVTFPASAFKKAQAKIDASASPQPSSSSAPLGSGTAAPGAKTGGGSVSAADPNPSESPVSDASSTSHTGRNLTIVVIVALLVLVGGGVAAFGRRS